MKAVALFSLVAVFPAVPAPRPMSPVHEVAGGAPAVATYGEYGPCPGAYGCDVPAAPVALEPNFYYSKRDAGYPRAPQAAPVLAAAKVATAALPVYGSYGHAYGAPRAPHSYYGKRDAQEPNAPAVHEVAGGAQAVTGPDAIRPSGYPVALEPYFYYNKRDAGSPPMAPNTHAAPAAPAYGSYGHVYGYPRASYTHKYYNKRDASRPGPPNDAPVPAPAPAYGSYVPRPVPQ